MQRRQLANAIRILSADGVETANSGHPGAPMGMADIAESLWRGFLRHNPNNPNWPNRDRFVLSNGHASMLLYSLLHLSGYDLSIDDLKAFRQLHSKTPGHPEFGYTPGVETTTGPLGQGLANAVGFALAERTLAAQYNTPDFPIINHHTYVFLGDGCLMEGISHEACALAGTQKLGKLIAFWDDNGISIDGEVDGWFTDNTEQRFESYGWHVISGVDGHNAESITTAIQAAQVETGRPTLICCKTTIGWGAPTKAGSHNCHGAPLGPDELKATRKVLSWPDNPFEVPDSVYKAWDARENGKTMEDAWNNLFQSYQATYPEKAAEIQRRWKGLLPEQLNPKLDDLAATLQAEEPKLASRKVSQMVLEKIVPEIPELLGGSADLTPSNLTATGDSKAITPNSPAGNYMHYGVREFGMSAIMNGVALYGGFIPYGGTFLMFMEYARNAVRMASLMKQKVIFVYTHDSIGLGEDGPTHQPVEQLAALRVTPHLETWRPCDAVETAVVWKESLNYNEGPSALILSRQGLPTIPRNTDELEVISRGGYVLKDSSKVPELILIASGSEVGTAYQAWQHLTESGIQVRLVSMPCTRRFDAQSETYRQLVLPPNVTKRISFEAGVSTSLGIYAGLEGIAMGIDTFGESGPAEALYQHFGLTFDNLVKKANKLLNSDQ